ncbi:MAG: methyltransferase domain-containing protein [Desulfobacteraceae bacterium]|nr:MAG: methyltransferase domain-containing protein [Desulfobacteraceae bacterium]
MFDETAEFGTRLVDAHLAAGTYHRATVLVNAVSRVTPQGGKVLDYGCGAGRISLLIARRGISVLGVEPSRELVRLANAQEAPGLPLAFRHISPSETGGVEGETFDSILCSSVIEFVPEPLDLLRRLRGLLRPMGCLLLSYANRASLWRFYAKLRFGRNERHFNRQLHVWHESEAWHILRQATFERAVSTMFFESPFDRYPALGFLSRLRAFGTLGLIIARRGNGD